jgi:hypothetical protein
MEDNLQKNGIQPKIKVEDDLKKKINGRRPQKERAGRPQKTRMTTSKKMEDNLK